jgi:hypothetical protein
MTYSHSIFRRLPSVLAVIALAVAAQPASAQNVGTFVLAKIQNFQQTSTTAPVADPMAPFQFGSFVSQGTATLNSATLTFNGGFSPKAYTPGTGAFTILDTFTTQAQLDAAYPTTTYTLNVDTSAGMFSKSISYFAFLGYPTLPRLTVPAADWQNGVLVIDPAVDYTLTWAPYSNATAADLIQLSIQGSGLSLAPFPASQNSFTIPAGTLQPGRTYSSDLAFLRVSGTTAADANFGAGFALLVRNTSFTIRTLTPALAFTGAVSTKAHGTTGVFSIPLAAGNAVESRTGGANGDHTIVFTFNNEIATANVAVTSGTATISGTPTIVGNTVTVNLTGVANAQNVTLTASQITDVFAQALPDVSLTVGFLLGDTNGDGTVNGGDALQTRNRAGQVTDATNFRSDFNLDGVVNGGDVIVARSRSGSSLTAAPTTKE